MGTQFSSPVGGSMTPNNQRNVGRRTSLPGLTPDPLSRARHLLGEDGLCNVLSSQRTSFYRDNLTGCYIYNAETQQYWKISLDQRVQTDHRILQVCRCSKDGELQKQIIEIKNNTNVTIDGEDQPNPDLVLRLRVPKIRDARSQFRYFGLQVIDAIRSAKQPENINTFYSAGIINAIRSTNVLKGYKLEYCGASCRVTDDTFTENKRVLTLSYYDSNCQEVTTETAEKKLEIIMNERASDEPRVYFYDTSESSGAEVSNPDHAIRVINLPLIYKTYAENNDKNSGFSIEDFNTHQVRTQLIRNFKDKMNQHLSDTRNLLQTYSSTLELVDAYNRADIFDRFPDGKSQAGKPANRFREQLAIVATAVIEEYKKKSFPSRAEILEVACLARITDRDVNTYLFNTMIGEINHFDSNSPVIPDINKVEGLSRVIRLLPPQFLSSDNCDKAFKLVSNLSQGLVRQFSQFNTVELEETRRITMLEMIAHLLDALLDNKILSEISRQSKEMGFRPLLESLQKDANNIEDLQNSIKGFFWGKGIKKADQTQITEALNKVRGSKNERLEYLASYANQALSRIPVEGETNRMEVVKRVVELINGAKSLAVIIASEGAAIQEYPRMIQHFKAVLTDSRMKQENWYNTARQLQILVDAAKGDSKLHRMLLNELSDIIDKTINWELVYFFIDNVESAVLKSGNTNNQQIYVGILSHFFRVGYVHSKVQKVVLDQLCFLAKDPDDSVRNLARNELKELISEKGWPQKTLELFQGLPSISSFPIREGVATYKDSAPENELLAKAKEKVLSLEVKTALLRQQVERFRAETIDNELKTYIPLLGERYVTKEKCDKDEPAIDKQSNYITTEKVNESLLKIVKDFTGNSESQVMLIKGQAGSGKSLFARYVEKFFWDQYEQGGMIPIVISLPSLSDPYHFGIEQALLEYGFSPYDIAKLKEEENDGADQEKIILKPDFDKGGVVKKRMDCPPWFVSFDRVKNDCPRLLVIFDGVDEIQAQFNLIEAYKISQWKSIKVIVISRTEYLLQFSDYLSLFEYRNQLPEEVDIVPFNEGQRISFINQMIAQKKLDNATDVLPSAKEYRDFTESVALGDLIRHPFILKIIVDIFPTLKEKMGKEKEAGISSKKLTRFDIYKTFIEHWIERESNRLKRVEKMPEGFQPERSILEYSKHVASFMFESRRQLIVGNSPNYSRVVAMKEEGVEFMDNVPKVRLSRMGAPLKKMGEASMGFIHKSIQEFFIANSILDDLKRVVETNKDLSPASVLNQRYIQEEPSVMRFIVDKMSIDIEAALKRIVHQSAEGRKNQEPPNVAKKSPIAVASANAMSLLVVAYQLQSKVFNRNTDDFSYIQIPGAKLDSGFFWNVNFIGADLSEVSANQALLSKCILDQALLKNINFGELPSIRLDSTVRSVDIHPKGKLFAAGLEGGSVAVWDKKTSLQKWFNSVDEGAITTVRFISDYLVTASSGGYIRFWDIANGNSAGEIAAHEGSVNYFSISKDSKFLASAGKDGFVKVWNIENVEKPDLFCEIKNSKEEAFSVCFHPKGSILASSGSDKKSVDGKHEDMVLKLWDICDSKNVTLLFERKPIYSSSKTKVDLFGMDMVFSLDGKKLFIQQDHSIFSLDVKDPGSVTTLSEMPNQHGGQLISLRLSHDGEMLISTSRDGTIHLRKTENGKLICPPLQGHGAYVFSAVLESSGELLISGGRDKAVRFWDAKKVGVEAVLTPFNSGHAWEVRTVEISPDGRYVVTGSADETCLVWDLKTGEKLSDYIKVSGRVISVSFSPSQSILAMGTDRGGIYFCKFDDDKFKTYKIISAENTPAEKTLKLAANPVQFSPGGKFVFSGLKQQGSFLISWDPETGKQLSKKMIDTDTQDVTCLSFHPKLPYLATTSWDKTIRLWDISYPQNPILLGDPLRNHDGVVRFVVFSPNGNFMATCGDDKRVLMWDISDIANPQCMSSKITHSDLVVSLSFRNDGKLLASGSSDRTVKLWDVSNPNDPNLISTLTGPTNKISSVKFNHMNDSQLVVGSIDKTAWVWNVENPAEPQVDYVLGKKRLNLDLRGVSASESEEVSEINKKLLGMEL